jgi:predicted RNA binding protein YcfA (HicA-like mRNA interferase family)
MPRKIRDLKSDLRQAGFREQRDRGKGSHTRWYHPATPEISVTLPGHDGDDAKPYLENQVRKSILRVQRDAERDAE